MEGRASGGDRGSVWPWQEAVIKHPSGHFYLSTPVALVRLVLQGRWNAIEESVKNYQSTRR